MAPRRLLQATGGVRDGKGGSLTFDVAAASALVEMPEYQADGLSVSPRVGGGGGGGGR